MRVFIVVTAAMLFVLLAFALCVQGSPAETSAGIELTLEIAPPGPVVLGRVGCTSCLETHVYNSFCENVQKATIAISAGTGTGTVLKLSRAAVEAKDWHREAIEMKVEVGAVGILL